MDVRVTDLTKTYNGRVRALDGVNLTITGGMVGLLGANGAGKTTLMRILTGIIPATSGSVLIGGHDVSRYAGRRAVARDLGYLPQHLDVYPDLTGREFLDYIGLLKNIDSRRARRAQVSALLERVSLSDAADRRLGGYSGGMKRRIGIAQALLGDPSLIIVDEPTAGLDPEERMRFRSLLASLGGSRTVILSTHILDDVSQTCPEVAVLATGRLVFSGPTTALVEAAAGQTFTVTTPGPPPVGDFAVVSAHASAGGTTYRLVAAIPPDGAQPAAPGIEDGYLALMRAGRQREPSD